MGRKSECRGCDQRSGKEFDSNAGDIGIDRFSRAMIGGELVLNWSAAQKQPAEDLGYSTTDSSVVP